MCIQTCLESHKQLPFWLFEIESSHSSTMVLLVFCVLYYVLRAVLLHNMLCTHFYACFA